MATIHPDELQQLDLRDKPALGAFVNLPEMVERREAARQAMRMSLADFIARRSALADLAGIHESLRRGRRLDLVASDLRTVADELDAVLQRRAGGWPVREVAA